MLASPTIDLELIKWSTKWTYDSLYICSAGSEDDEDDGSLCSELIFAFCLCVVEHRLPMI